MLNIKRSKKRKRNASQPTERNNKRRKTKEKIAKYCICRKPWDGKAMIQCPTCSEWFHYICISLKQTSKPVYSDEFFPCPFCVKNANGDPGKLAGKVAENSNLCKNDTMNMLENAANTPELSIRSRTENGKIKEQNLKDKSEQYLWQKIDALRSKRADSLRAIEKSKKQIEQKYDDMIGDLKKLSANRCVKCGESQDVSWFEKCSSCEKEVCRGCMLKCEAGDGDECGSEKYYCCDACCDRGLCEGGCERRLCDYCFEQYECSKCSTKICESCVESYDYGFDECAYIPNEVTLCKECYNYETDKPRSY